MSRKLDFKWKWNRLIEIVSSRESHEITDVDLMTELCFSPPSWKVWKPMFIEKSNQTLITYNSEIDKSGHKISYYKKEKMWRRENYPKYN